MGLISGLTSLFKAGGTDGVSKSIGEARGMVDDLFTSDEERQQFTSKMAEIEQKSQSPIARTGRGAIMWGIAIIMVYQAIARELLNAIFGLGLPEASMETSELITKAFSLMAGVL